MTRPALTVLTASALALLAACGERGPSDEMLEAEGTANAPGTEIDESAARAEFDGPGGGELGDRSDSMIGMQPGGDGDGTGVDDDGDEDYDPRSPGPNERPEARRGAMRDAPGGDMVGADGVARTPGVAGGPAQGAEATAASLRQRLSPEQESLQDVVDHERRADDASRDRYRHPVDTLSYLGLEPDMTVVEVWPGGGYYTEIIAPYLAEGGGTYYAAGFDPEAGEYQRERLAEYREQYADEPAVYGDVNMTVLAPGQNDVAPAGMADMVLTFRNVHNWTMNGFAPEAFAGFYEALKPGGVLGVVEHRLPEEADDAVEESSGYVKTSTIVRLAEGAGFELVGSSEVNANPADTADHPFGVWTLPPTSRTEGRDGTTITEEEAARYAAIGESDRATLKFVKPLGADGALME